MFFFAIWTVIERHAHVFSWRVSVILRFFFYWYRDFCNASWQFWISLIMMFSWSVCDNQWQIMLLSQCFVVFRGRFWWWYVQFWGFFYDLGVSFGRYLVNGFGFWSSKSLLLYLLRWFWRNGKMGFVCFLVLCRSFVFVWGFCSFWILQSEL